MSQTNINIELLKQKPDESALQKMMPFVAPILLVLFGLAAIFFMETFGETGRYDERVNFMRFLTKSECQIVDIDSDGKAKLNCPSRLASKDLDEMAGAAYLDRRSNGDLWVSYWPNQLVGHYSDANTKYAWLKEPSVGYVGEIDQHVNTSFHVIKSL